ncbi:MAG: hypothetical protein EPN21_13910 [Methylococcaceae bacterium]|nr:MAG: hypothetical protein EPN21_13910 [Methylococcaceae bacterium]
MIVVKLGGSLAGSPYLQSWLDALAEHGAGRVIIVPGGGLFADSVRAAQTVQAFDNYAAHAMALLAMHQYGWMLRGLRPELLLETNVDRLLLRMSAGRCMIWLPDLAQLDAAGIPAGWDITSDSLAAWLAGQLRADALLMIKSAAIPPQATLERLQHDGIIDPAFAGYLQTSACRLHWLGPEDSARLPELLNDSAPTTPRYTSARPNSPIPQYPPGFDER